MISSSILCQELMAIRGVLAQATTTSTR
ncbi:unnamed protein product [Cuscuta europaea]|uniref:Uncharacterized protein n=1 Tax=Cuscuta europaea TaxID=41803 RepID=A0A9P0ZA79_CUSEU|nr:unnamed protein product [Cuscuta europaea]